MKTQTIQEKQAQQNKLKLIQQNKTLYKQIHQLQIQLNKVLQQTSVQTNKKDHKQNQDNSSSPMDKILKQQIFHQQAQMKRLKQKIYYLKSSNAKANALYIQKEQNQLLCLKRQKEALVQQKIVMQRGTKDKRTVLQINKNLLQHKTDLQKDWNAAKSYNKQSQLKIVQIQRTIRKYHYINQINKKVNKDKNNQNQTTNQNIEDLAFKISQIEGQTLHQKDDIRKVQQKWKQQLQALDQQYFQIKAIFNRQQTKIQNFQKQMHVIKHRAIGLRQERDIISERKKLQKMSQSKSFHTESFNKRIASPVTQQKLSKNSKTQFLLTQFSIMKQKAKLIADANNNKVNSISYSNKRSKVIPSTTKFNQTDIKRSYSLHQSKQSIDDLKTKQQVIAIQEPKVEIKKNQKLQKQKSKQKLSNNGQYNQTSPNNQGQKYKRSDVQNQKKTIKINKQSSRYSKQNQKNNVQIPKIEKSQDKKISQVNIRNNNSIEAQKNKAVVQNQVKKSQTKTISKEDKKQHIKKSIQQKNKSIQKQKKITQVKVSVQNNKSNNKILDSQIKLTQNNKQKMKSSIEKQSNNQKSKDRLKVNKEQDRKKVNKEQDKRKVNKEQGKKKDQLKNQKVTIAKSNSKQTIKNQNKIINPSIYEQKYNHQQNKIHSLKKDQKEKQKIQIFISNRKTKKQQKKQLQSSKDKKQTNQIKTKEIQATSHEQHIHNSENSNATLQQQIRRVLRKKVSMNTSEMGVGTQF